MKFINHTYPLALLAFCLYLVYTDHVWFSVLVFLISALCWFALQIDLTKTTDYEEFQ